MATKQFKYQLKYNNMDVGKYFYTKKSAKMHFNELWNKGLYGYTLWKI